MQASPKFKRAVKAELRRLRKLESTQEAGPRYQVKFKKAGANKWVRSRDTSGIDLNMSKHVADELAKEPDIWIAAVFDMQQGGGSVYQAYSKNYAQLRPF